MRSSTFVSERNWALKSLLGALALFLAFTVAFELLLRSRGYTPGIDDDKDLWSMQRSQVYGEHPKPLVLVGASRTLLDFSIDEFHRLHPGYPVAQLAVDGLSPVATLRDLADDERFHGIVLFGFIDNMLIPSRFDEQESYVSYYHRRWSFERKLNRILLTWLQERMATLHSGLNPVKFALAGRIPAPDPLKLVRGTHPDRSVSADFSKLVLDAGFYERMKQGAGRFFWHIPEEKWLDEAMRIDVSVKKIQARGGKVIFIRYPSTGYGWTIEEQYYPKDRYWDAFAARTSGAALHFRDSAALSGFNCPETSHLDYRDTAAFTDALLEELSKRGIARF